MKKIDRKQPEEEILPEEEMLITPPGMDICPEEILDMDFMEEEIRPEEEMLIAPPGMDILPEDEFDMDLLEEERLIAPSGMERFPEEEFFEPEPPEFDLIDETLPEIPEPPEKKPRQCSDYRNDAIRYKNKYNTSRNNDDLCMFYRYMAEYYQCLYNETGNDSYLCKYYYFMAKYYKQTKRPYDKCEYYHHIALYYQCRYLRSPYPNKSYWCHIISNMMNYNKCLYQQTRNETYLRKAHFLDGIYQKYCR